MADPFVGCNPVVARVTTSTRQKEKEVLVVIIQRVEAKRFSIPIAVAGWRFASTLNGSMGLRKSGCIDSIQGKGFDGTGQEHGHKILYPRK
jgi:hypothetical protein